MSAHEMRLAAKLLSGESIESADLGGGADEDFQRLYVSDSEDDSITEIQMDRQNRQLKARELIYNESDDDDEQRAASNVRSSTNGVDMFDMIRNENNQINNDIPNALHATDRNSEHENFDSEEFNSQVIRRRLAELDDSDSDSDNETGTQSLHLTCAIASSVHLLH